MSEQERLAYIEKHPIKPSTNHIKDFRWRGPKAAKKTKMVAFLIDQGFQIRTLSMLRFENLSKLAADYNYKG